MEPSPATAANSTSAKGAPQKGVVLGRDINLFPKPPACDLLSGPLLIPKLPHVVLPREKMIDRLAGLLLGFGPAWRANEYQQMWRLRRTTAAVMASVSTEAAKQLQAAGWLQDIQNGGQSQVLVTHPDNLRPAFEILMKSPDIKTRDQRDLELLLAVTLRKYSHEMSSIVNGKFSFQEEAHEHCLQAYNIERQLTKVSDPLERLAVLQNVYEFYYHAKNYYEYSLISRENRDDSGKMFNMYCRAVFFISRLGWNGNIADYVNRKKLPSRRHVTFLVNRDRYLHRRCASDPNFSTEIANIVGFFQ